jgi:DNA polymerase I-like protein with 3'-5' exonuclease and polymerase domains
MKFPMRRYANNVQAWQIERGLVDAQKVEGSTDALALLQLQNAHPVIPMIIARRKFAKDAGFLRAWLKASEQDGRIHAQITNTTVVSGRLSMRDPNLQQVKLPHRVLFTADLEGPPEY